MMAKTWDIPAGDYLSSKLFTFPNKFYEFNESCLMYHCLVLVVLNLDSSALLKIARGLIESKQCDLTFCSTLSLNTWINSLKYLEANQFCSYTIINQRIAQSSRVNFTI